MRLGAGLAALERYEESIVAFDRAIGLQPGNHKCWLQRARVLERAQRNHDAMRSYEIAVGIDPNCQFIACEDWD